MKNRALALLLSLSLLTGDVLACAACRNPSMPLTKVNGDELAKGQLRVGAALTGTSVRVVHAAGCAELEDCDEATIQPLHHHVQRLTPFELRLQGEYSITEQWGVEVQFPVRLVMASVEYETPDGQHYDPPDTGVHHRNETLLGVGDPWLLGRFTLANQLWAFTARLGVSLPLGRTEENPFALGDRGEQHQHVQMGTGTFDPIISLDLSRSWAKVRTRAYFLGVASVYENGHGLRSPTRFQSGLFAGGIFSTRTVVELGPELTHESAERWDGKIEQDGSLGRSELLLGANVTQEVGTTSFFLSLRMPLYRKIRASEEQALAYSAPLIGSLGFTQVF